MGKQYNKVIKRRRRAMYVAKKKAAIKALLGKAEKGTKTKAAKPKASRKTITKKEKVADPKPEPVASKANPIDVLGDDAKSSAVPKVAPEIKEEKSQEESKDSAQS